MRFSVSIVVAGTLFACGLALAGEDDDFGVPPTRELRLTGFAAPTPREVPGARTVRTSELQAWLRRDVPARPVLFDVVGGEEHDSIPGAVWLPGAGRGDSFSDGVQGQLAYVLELLGGRPGAAGGRGFVFFCASVHCWLSYNAALRAVALGYTEVYWYRGGIEAWLDAGGELRPMIRTWRPNT
jgi:PQQ-dependent catabolism-associated CXXCW motif protein